MKVQNPEPKIGMKLYISEALDQRIKIAFADPLRGGLKFGTMTRVVGIALDKLMKDAAEKLQKRSVEFMEIGSPEWWAEMRRRAAADEITAEDAARCVDLLREGRKTAGAVKEPKGKKATVTVAATLEDLL